MNAPELVLADEPTGNLDRASALQVMELIGQINREEGTTFLISTHDEKIASLCRRQIVVGDGLVTGDLSCMGHSVRPRSMDASTGRPGVLLRISDSHPA